MNQQIYNYIEQLIANEHDKLFFDKTKKEIKEVFDEINNALDNKFKLILYGEYQEGIGSKYSNINFIVNYKYEEDYIKNVETKNVEMITIYKIFRSNIFGKYQNRDYTSKKYQKNKELYIKGIYMW